MAFVAPTFMEMNAMQQRNNGTPYATPTYNSHAYAPKPLTDEQERNTAWLKTNLYAKHKGTGKEAKYRELFYVAWGETANHPAVKALDQLNDNILNFNKPASPTPPKPSYAAKVEPSEDDKKDAYVEGLMEAVAKQGEEIREAFWAAIDGMMP